MTDHDRELLEKAAKVAGACLHPPDQISRSYGNWGCDTTCMVCKEDPAHARWNPLTDDGDALRLAVKLGLSIEVRHDAAQPLPWLRIVDRAGNWTHCGPSDYQGDELEQTRRAIVRAAASMAAGT
jgi:hypothetical protein